MGKKHSYEGQRKFCRNEDTLVGGPSSSPFSVGTAQDCSLKDSEQHP